MNRKKKIRMMIVIMPTISILVLGALLSFVIIAGSQGAPTALAAAVAPEAGVAGYIAGSEGTGVSSSGAGSEGSGMELPEDEQNIDPALLAPAAMACDFDGWTGKAPDEAAVKATGRPYRIIREGEPVTMDYSAARINLELDGQGMVKRVFCG